MKISYTFLLFFCLANIQLGFGQIVPLSNSHVHFDFEVDDNDYFQDIDGKLALQYTGEDTVRIVWERNVLSLPTGWETAVCDPQLCYLPGVSTESFVVVPNQIFDLALHVYPRQIEGDSGRVKLTLYVESKPEEKFEFTYSFENSTVSSASDNSGPQQRPSIYPNPASESISIKNAEGVSRIEVFNLVGQMEFSQSFNAGSSIEINSLKSGMYFVKLMDDHHKIIRTLRLNKQ